MLFRRVVIVACLFVVAASAAATGARGADHMWMGFQDDPTLRWRPGHAAAFDKIAQFNASVVRTTVYWSKTAPQKPRRAQPSGSDPFGVRPSSSSYACASCGKRSGSASIRTMFRGSW